LAEEPESSGGGPAEDEPAEPPGAAQPSGSEPAAQQRPAEAGEAEHAPVKGILTIEQFRKRFDSGCRVVQTPRFHDVMPVDRPSLVIRDALDRTERSEEIVALVPPAIRRRLVELLFRMYGRGIVELADIE
jgi:hypothetical protein